ncbi:MAG TPA: TOMM precursor leader peptide-binding protein [Trebonia sp.]|nr:TOMM precursor leader peptide-binding protein [Trebonia sp.]
MRPALKAGLSPLWRDQETIQFGIDPRRAVAMTGLGKAIAVLSLLDGSRDTDELVRAASDRGSGPEATHEVLRLLASAGMLDDYPARLHRSLPDYLRGRLAPEMACASLADGDGDGGARTIERRRAAFVRVHGAGRVGACVATLLAAAGVARVSCLDTAIPGHTVVAGHADTAPAGLGVADVGRPRAIGVARAIARIAPDVSTRDDARLVPDLVVLTAPASASEAAALMRDRVPHLAVQAAEAVGTVGPLVYPGRSACLRCVDLAKADRDPAWPKILGQAAEASAVSPAACDTVLAAATAALAAAQALALIDGSGRRPATVNGALDLVLPDWQWRRRGWAPSPACSCGAADRDDCHHPRAD